MEFVFWLIIMIATWLLNLVLMYGACFLSGTHFTLLLATAYWLINFTLYYIFESRRVNKNIEEILNEYDDLQNK